MQNTGSIQGKTEVEHQDSGLQACSFAAAEAINAQGQSPVKSMGTYTDWEQSCGCEDSQAAPMLTVETPNIGQEMSLSFALEKISRPPTKN